MKKQPWFEYPNFISFPNKGMKVMYPNKGYIYEVFVNNIFPYDYWDNDGIMAVSDDGGYYCLKFEGEEGISITCLEEADCGGGITTILNWDRKYAIPQ